MKIGMTAQQAIKVMNGGKIIDLRDELGVDPRICSYLKSPENSPFKDVDIMLTRGQRVGELQIGSFRGSHSASERAIRTSKGVSLGDPEAKVLAAYPGIIDEGPQSSDERPAHYLGRGKVSKADRTNDADRDIRFYIGHNGKVQTVRAGWSWELGLWEGCLHYQ